MLSIIHLSSFLSFRKRIEDYRKSYNKALTDLDTFIESLQELKTLRPSKIGEILKRRAGNCAEMQNIIKIIIKSGKSVFILSDFS